MGFHLNEDENLVRRRVCRYCLERRMAMEGQTKPALVCVNIVPLRWDLVRNIPDASVPLEAADCGCCDPYTLCGFGRSAD